MNKVPYKEDLTFGFGVIKNVPHVKMDEFECRTLKTEITLARIAVHMKKNKVKEIDFEKWSEET